MDPKSYKHLKFIKKNINRISPVSCHSLGLTPKPEAPDPGTGKATPQVSYNTLKTTFGTKVSHN